MKRNNLLGKSVLPGNKHALLFLFSTFFEMLLCWFSPLQMVLARFQEI